MLLWQTGTPLEASSIWNVDEIGWNIEMDKQMILFRTNSKSTNTLNFNRGEHMRTCCATTPEGVKTAMTVFYLLSQRHEEQVNDPCDFSMNRIDESNSTGKHLIMTPSESRSWLSISRRIVTQGAG